MHARIQPRLDLAQARAADIRFHMQALRPGIGCQAHSVEALHPWEAIIDHAKRENCDLLVMASHGRRGVASLLLGSETQKVLTHTTVPVLVVR